MLKGGCWSAPNNSIHLTTSQHSNPTPQKHKHTHTHTLHPLQPLTHPTPTPNTKHKTTQAYVQEGGEWFVCNDAWVQRAPPKEVMAAQGYLLFYAARRSQGTPAL
jgi:hypothetical protein